MCGTLAVCGASQALRAAHVLRLVLLAIAAAALPAGAGDFDLQIGRTQSLLIRNAQDQQFIQGQAQLAQTQLRMEESQRLTTQSRVRLIAAPRLDLVGREASPGSERTQTHLQELDQLAWRLQELEAQRRVLVHTLSTQRVQQMQAERSP